MTPKRSKIDRVQALFAERLRDAVRDVRLGLHVHGRHDDAQVLASLGDELLCRMCAMGTYERLELADIIKGHKRAWPET